MNKIKAAVLYECSTSFKALCIFYLLQYGIVMLITLSLGIVLGDFENVGTNGLEMNTIIFVGIFGVLGFKEDFKMLIQNGFTRKYIFFATMSLFVFMSGTMALIDTLVGQFLHEITKEYQSIFGSIYGYENLFANWIWLFFLYLLILSLFYLSVLVINKVGNTAAIYLSIVLGGVILLLVALFRFVLSDKTVSNILELCSKLMGFMADGTVNFLFPALTLFVLGGILGVGAYVLLGRTELK